ncbi:hypothetical protein [Pyruvatibacter mobilis]|uniref:hypothetical protein n=1 Tax=Pyruvatibacter mobilis TaxID=1712261 RepID=UPI003BAC302F
MAEERPIIFMTTCQGCGQQLPAREDKAGRGFYRCNGKYGGIGCGHISTFGHEPTRKLKADAVAAKLEDAKTAKPLKEKPAKEAVTDDQRNGSHGDGKSVGAKFLRR